MFSRTASYDRPGLALFVLLAFAIFVSKAAVNIIYGLLFFLSLLACFRREYRDRLFTHHGLAYFLVPLAVGCFLSLFSMSGIKGPVEFLMRYRFLLLVLPYFLFMPSKKAVFYLLGAMNIGALVGMLYAVAHTNLDAPFEAVYGFHKFGRHSDMLFTLCLANLTWFAVALKNTPPLKPTPGHLIARLKKAGQRKWAYGFLGINTILLFITILCIGQRGAYLGLYCGLTVLFIIFSRRLLILLFLLTLAAPLFMPDYVINRTRSIVDSNLESNSHRLRLLSIGKDFFIQKKLFITGAGVESVAPGLQAFLETQPKAYQARYNGILHLYPDNFHSSYFQMAVEAGLPFVILYLGALIALSVQIIRTRGFSQTFVLTCAIVLLAGFGLSQLFHEEFFRYGGLVFFLLFYGSCIRESGTGLRNTPG